MTTPHESLRGTLAVALAVLQPLLAMPPAATDEVGPAVPLAEAVIPAAMLEQPYPALRQEYRKIVAAAVSGYLDSAGAITRWRNIARRAVVDYFSPAFYTGYADAGADEVEPADDAWLTDRTNEELGYIDELFAGLRDKRGNVDAAAEGDARADGYATTLDAVHAEGRLRSAKRRMLTWRLGQTEKHCKDCLTLNGQRHTAGWYLKRNFIPRKPGAAMACTGRHCDCRLDDDDGNEVTI
jgi:hypothetical protein